eukprot:TRINITY_DN23629_c0_g1_i2.p1 TRINITY_DN23629_c0_g1~~TRINITY_DN23629_c0_g1_i2.p1  ORF type:complete len:135 (+),score=28.98 TRINITY_DN23629_c0_g1_i2:57-461(+)
MLSCCDFFFFLMIRRPPRSTQGVSSAASDVYKRQTWGSFDKAFLVIGIILAIAAFVGGVAMFVYGVMKSNSKKDIVDLLLAYLSVSYTHLRAHETSLHLVCRLLLEKKKKTKHQLHTNHPQHQQSSFPHNDPLI